MPRVTLYLPTALYERFQPYRDKLNLSTVLQMALANELTLLESASEGGSVISDEEVKVLINEGDLIARLKREKAESDEGWYKRGVEDGIRWARTAHYRDIRVWGQAQVKDLLTPRRTDNVPEVMRDFVDTYWKEPGWDYRAFVRGWLAGVKRVLRLVQGNI